MDETDFQLDNANQIDPDPLSTMLVILSAIGSIVSIVAYAESKFEQLTVANRNNAELNDMYTDLISKMQLSYADLITSIDDIRQILISFPARNQSNLARSPFIWGGYHIEFKKRDQVEKYMQLEENARTNALKAISATDAFILFCLKNDLRISKTSLNEIFQIKNELNRILQSMSNMTYERALSAMNGLSSTALRVISHIKSELQTN